MPSGAAFPTSGAYRDALYNTTLCFRDPDLRGGEPTLDPLGMPKAVSGAFASVFTIRSADQRKWAVKCFTRRVGDQADRYQHISQALSAISKPWRVDCEYLPTGILVDGQWYPVLKMEWVEATGLIPFIESHLRQPASLDRVAGTFVRMLDDLSAAGIAHGDLQHGNLLVTPAGELKLIDYDGMFVPGLEQLGASEKGHVNYQSPARSMRDWGLYLDNFSAWVIYSSLVSLAVDPTLWDRLPRAGDEALLFHEDDFGLGGSSPALVALSGSTDSGLRQVGQLLSVQWAADWRAIPRLTADIEAAVLVSLPALRVPAASPGLPDWIVEARGGVHSTVPVAGGGSAPGQTPPVAVLPFAPPLGPLKVFGGMWVLPFAAVEALGFLGKVPPAFFLNALKTLAAVFLLVAYVLFRRTPEWRAKHSQVVVFNEGRAEYSRAVRAADEARKMMPEVDLAERTASDDLRTRAGDARTAEDGEIAAVDAELAARLTAIGERKKSLQIAHADDIGTEYERQLQSLNDEGHRARADASGERAGVRQKWAAQLAGISAELTAGQQDFAQRRAQLDTQLTEARSQARDASRRGEQAQRELAALAQVTYYRYLVFALRTLVKDYRRALVNGFRRKP